MKLVALKRKCLGNKIPNCEENYGTGRFLTMVIQFRKCGVRLISLAI
jgi:hypothetical protein